MKTNESIDDSRGSTDLSPVDTGAVIQGAASTPENKRRRLVRGAVAFAPLVLTLRSGALAAASCTGARTYNGTAVVTIPNNKKIPTSVGAAPGDTCYRATDVTLCPDQPWKLENPPLAPLTSTTVTGTAPDDLHCGSSPAWTGNVAILSATQAATSFAR